jgi:hypothetical protein
MPGSICGERCGAIAAALQATAGRASGTICRVLIDDRIPPFSDPSEPDRPVWEPNWRVWAWALAAVALLAGSYLASGLLAYVLLCAMVACAAKAFSRALPDPFGMREYRQ